MSQRRTDILEVPGAHLHYEVSGTGPVLLLIPGGPADSSGFAELRDVLSDRYTVVTYDPRGLSNSPFDGEPHDMTPEDFAHDAHRLLAALATEPAYVLGDSGGGLVGLELVAAHPERVRALVAHEPPCVWLLDDAAEHAALGREVYDTYRSDGVGAAMGKFLASAGLEGGVPPTPSEPTPEAAEAMARMGRNLDFFLGHMWMPMNDYSPDVTRLLKLPITVAVGEDSTGQLAHRAATELAARLGQQPVDFPGGHSGMGSPPDAFARRLHEVLSAQ